MPHCAIVNCKNSSKAVGRANGDVSFHRFPNDPDLIEKWIMATGHKNWFPTKYSTICSIHFHDGHIAVTDKHRRLKTKIAYPTINILNTINPQEDTSYQHRTSKKASVSKKPKKRKLEKESSTSKEKSLKTENEKKIERELDLAKKQIRQQRIKMAKLRELCRRRAQRIYTLTAMLNIRP